MNLRNTLLIIQIISIGVLFIESCIVFKRQKKSIHACLLLGSISILINNMGYLLELLSKTEESYIAALKFSYFGRAWYSFFIFLFAAELVGKKIPDIVRSILVFINVAVYSVIFTIPYNTLYYSWISFETDGPFPVLHHGNGIVHHIMMTIQFGYVAVVIGMLAAAYRKEKRKNVAKCMITVIIAILVQAAGLVVQLLGIVELTEYYDVTMLGYFFGTVIMFIAIFRYDLLGIGELAKDFLIDRISEGIIAVDNNGVVQYCNEPFTNLYPELESGDKTGNVINGIEEAVKDGNNIIIKDRIYTPEKNDLLHNGENYGKLYALVDETDHYRYMEELEKQKEIADSANESKSRFLANMSHEIRTPINAVLGMDEMILRESKEKTIRTYASNIMSAGRTLLSLINDILDFSKVEEGKMEIIPVQYELSSMINDLVHMIRDRASEKGLGFGIEVDEDIPHLLYGDEIRIKQCVLNLLTNAVKYTESGAVSLKVAFRETDDEHILITFRVKDTGIGMKKEDMEKLFSPYKRLDEKRNRNIEGTGLGMTITRQLLELMGSRLDVESERGKGSVISFFVKQKVISRDGIGDIARRLDETIQDASSYHELFHAETARVLVVDDTEMNLEVIKNLLKTTGIGIDTALSGKEALTLTAGNRYDVIFIDHMMPDMDGIETLENIRKNGKNMETPAVALTANAVSGARQKYLQAGFTDYLSKPIDSVRLEKMLIDLLPAEKISIKFEHVAEDTVEADEYAKLPERIKNAEVIDADTGLKNCGTAQGFLSVLDVFCRTAEQKADEIEKFYEEGDIPGYTVKVHALKSSARIIGAGILSDLARELEDAGRSEDTDLIKEKTQSLLNMYRDTAGKLSENEDRNQLLPVLEKEALKEAYQTVVEIGQSMDYELMDGIIKQLRGYRLEENDADTLVKIENSFTELDWDNITGLAREALKRHG